MRQTRQRPGPTQQAMVEPRAREIGCGTGVCLVVILACIVLGLIGELMADSLFDEEQMTEVRTHLVYIFNNCQFFAKAVELPISVKKFREHILYRSIREYSHFNKDLVSWGCLNISSLDPNYANGATNLPDVLIAITDNDQAKVSINPPQLNITEGGLTATYVLSLTSQPTAIVTVTFIIDENSHALLSAREKRP